MNNFIYLISDQVQKSLEKNDTGVLIERFEDIGSSKIKFLRSGSTHTIEDYLFSEFKISNTGDEYDHKICDRCFKRLETTVCFENNRHKKNNLITKRPSCKACRKIKNGKSISTTDRKIWDLKKPKGFEVFNCPICDKTSIAGLTKIVLDHCHLTGKVRGHLCESCNTGIGRFDDNPYILEKAKKWLS